jgi:hypothetical protein
MRATVIGFLQKQTRWLPGKTTLITSEGGVVKNLIIILNA